MAFPRDPYGPRPAVPGGYGPQPEPTPEAPEADGNAYECPECGRELPNMDARRKESITHWGDKPLPVNHETLIARQKQADLMGEERPTR